MNLLYNFHSHSHLCDGKEPLEAYVNTAIDKGFKALGFSGHSPVPFENEWSLSSKNYPIYKQQIRELKTKYAGKIDLYLGLEIDYIPGFSEDFQALMQDTPLDYCIGSVHMVRGPENGQLWAIDGPEAGYYEGVKDAFAGNYQKAVTAFYQQSIQMIETQKPHIIGHIDKVKMYNKERFFDTHSSWYQQLIDNTLQACKENQVIVELNTRGVYTGKYQEYFPSVGVLQKCLKMDIPVMVNTDAHHPNQLDQHFKEAHQLLKELGFKKITTPFFETEL